MIYWLGYSIYSSQILVLVSVLPSQPKRKDLLSDLENHGWQQNPCPELIRGSDTPELCFIAFEYSIYISQNPGISVSPYLAAKEKGALLWPREPWMSTESMTWNNQRKWLTRIMPYWLGYSIYSSKNPSTSVSPSLAAKEKRLPSDIEIHGLPQNPWPEIIRGSDKLGLCFIGLGTVYIAPKILVLVSGLPLAAKEKWALYDLDSHRWQQNPWPELIKGSDTPGLCLIGLSTVYIAPKILILMSVLPWQSKRNKLSLT